MSSDHSTPSKTDFNFFKSEVKFWIDKLNLRDWRWDVDIGDTDGNFAEAEINYGPRVISITLSDYFPIENRQTLLKETAFHEVFEAGVLGRVRIMTESRNFDADEMEAEFHSIVFRCQHLLLPLRGK